MFRMLVLQSLTICRTNRSNIKCTTGCRSRGFWGLASRIGIPDGTTLWLFRETLAKAGLIEKLFEHFGRQLEAKGYIAQGSQMVDATIVPVPEQRNSRDENDDVKAGRRLRRGRRTRRNRRKDEGRALNQEARQELLRLQNHVNADAKHELIRQYDVTNASAHDSRKFDQL